MGCVMAVPVTQSPSLLRGQDDDLREDGVALEEDYSTAQRVAMAKRGAAIPVRNTNGEIVGGRYPIDTSQDVENAVADHGRSGGGAEEQAHIVKNARRVGATGKLPDDWKTKPAKRREAGRKVTKVKPRVKAKAKQAKKAKLAVRESLRIFTEAAVTKKGSAYEATIVKEGKGNPEDKKPLYERGAAKGGRGSSVRGPSGVCEPPDPH